MNEKKQTAQHAPATQNLAGQGAADATRSQPKSSATENAKSAPTAKTTAKQMPSKDAAANTAAVLVGGAVGACCRFGGNDAINAALPLVFPLGILIINVVGAFCMGLLQGSIKKSGSPHTLLYSLLGTGFLGGFTTFSTFGLDTVTLATGSHVFYSALNIILNAGICIPAAALGYRAFVKQA